MEESAILSAASSSIKRITYPEIVSIYNGVPDVMERCTLFRLKDIFNSMVNIISGMEFTIHMQLVEGRENDPEPRHWQPPNFVDAYKSIAHRSLTAFEEECVQRLDGFWKLYISHVRTLDYPIKLKISFPANGRQPKRRKLTFEGRLTEDF